MSPPSRLVQGLEVFGVPLVAEALGAFLSLSWGWSFPSFLVPLEHINIISVFKKKTSLFSNYFQLFFSIIFEKKLDKIRSHP